MKAIFLGLCALLMATTVFASSDSVNTKKNSTATIASTNTKTQIAELAKKQQGRQRYCITLTYAVQAGDRTKVLMSANYTQSSCPAVSCNGSVCVCAIYAFPDGTTGKPRILGDSILYNQLMDYVDDGIWDNPHAHVELKDEE